MRRAGRDCSRSEQFVFLGRNVAIKHKRSSATRSPKPQSVVELRGWHAIAHYLGMPVSTIHRWKKEGIPVQRQGRDVVG
jgi:hypothetical protein